MPLLQSHHLLLLLLVALATSHGDSSGATYNSSMCLNQTYKCGELSISYPFYLYSETEELNGYNNSYCGYPGMGIVCDDDKPILQLNGTTANYTVKSISGASANVSLADPEVVDGRCPRVDHNVTLAPGAWLDFPDNTVDYLVFFLSCYFQLGLVKPPTLDPITCSEFGLPGVSFVLLNTSVPPGNWSQACLQVIQVPVLKLKYEQADPNDPAWGNTGYGKVLREGFQVSWDKRPAQCAQCEESNGRCAYNQAGGFVSCLHPNADHSSGDTRSLRLKRQKLYIIAGSSSIIFIFLLLFACLLGYKRYGSKIISKVTSKIKSFIENWTGKISKRTQRIESFLQKNGTPYPKRFKYAEVKKITKYFAAKLGQGGFGAVYKGNLSDGRQVAVKILHASKGDGEEFINEVASISRTSHVNIVGLLGFCLEGSKRALIYEYMPNGSLERYVFNSSSKDAISITWEKLFHIAVGIGRGLEYLHRGCSTRIVHFDIKPHNILLDEEFCPKISDFGMAKLCVNKESIISIGGARGTIGYIAPEVFSKHFGAVSSKSDVYSYGMMVLEMVGAREKNINDSESSSQYFPQWIYEHLDDYCVSASEINGEITEIVRKMIVVGLWCIQVSPSNRPTMTRVVEMLEGTTSGLELPPKVHLSFFEDRVMSLS